MKNENKIPKIEQINKKYGASIEDLSKKLAGLISIKTMELAAEIMKSKEKSIDEISDLIRKYDQKYLEMTKKQLIKLKQYKESPLYPDYHEKIRQEVKNMIIRKNTLLENYIEYLEELK